MSEQRDGWSNSRITGTLLLLVFAGGAVYAAARDYWTVGLFDMFFFDPKYADLVAILAAGEARAAGLDVYVPIPMDPLARPHVYGPGWFVTGMLGLDVRDATWLGLLLVVVFLGTAAWIIAPARPIQVLVALAILCSPPVLLGVSRGNNDLIVFLLFAASGWLLAGQSKLRGLGGGAMTGIAALLKFYPAVALVTLLMRPGSRRARLIETAGVIALCAGLALVWREDYRRALQHTPNPETVFAYGFKVVIATWRALPGFRAEYIAGWVGGVVIVVALLLPRYRQVWSTVPAAGFGRYAFLLGAISWAACYCVGSNYPYRLVLLLLLYRVWLSMRGQPVAYDTGRIQAVLWAFVGWLWVPKNLWVRLAGADQTLQTPAWSWLKVVIGLEQGLMATLTAALLVSLTGAIVARWRDADAGSTLA